jgi:hypothetical protein
VLFLHTGLSTEKTPVSSSGSAFFLFRKKTPPAGLQNRRRPFSLANKRSATSGCAYSVVSWWHATGFFVSLKPSDFKGEVNDVI